MREAEGDYQMIGEEEKSIKIVENLIKEQKITNLVELKVKLGTNEEVSPRIEVYNSESTFS